MKAFEEKLQLLKNEDELFLAFLRSRFPLFHNSNFFFRDFHYGIIKFFESKEIKIKYPEAEVLAEKLGLYFEQKGIFVKVNEQAWKFNYPEYVTATPGDPF